MFLSSNNPFFQRAKMDYDYDGLYEVARFSLDVEDVPENVLKYLKNRFKVDKIIGNPYADSYSWFVNIVSFNSYSNGAFKKPINDWYFCECDEILGNIYEKPDENVCRWLNGFCKLFHSYFLEYGISYNEDANGIIRTYHRKDEYNTEINLNDCYVEQIGLKPAYENDGGVFSGFKVNMNLLLKKFDKE